MKKLLAMTLALIIILSLSACTGKGEELVQGSKGEDTKDNKEIVTVTVWGLNAEEVGSGNAEMIDAFHTAYPNIRIEAQTTPGAEGNNYSTADVSKLLAAIAAGSPPDVTVLDRFLVSQFAARGALSPLDELIANSDMDINEYESYTVDEVTFDGSVWGIPTGTDTRVLFWNKDEFARVGLDPEKPPTTWDELLEYGEKLTVLDENGKIEKAGFIPNYGNSWLYLYGFQNGGQFLSDDGRTAMLNQPEIVEALEFMVKGYDIAGGAENVKAFQGDLGKGPEDPFLHGQVAMKIDGNWNFSRFARYKPDLNFGVALAPTPDGTNPITWAGGWSYAIPKGAKNPEEALEVIKYVTTEGELVKSEARAKYNKEEQGSEYFIPGISAHTETANKLYQKYIEPLTNDRLKEGYKLADEAKNVALHRPVTPVGGVLWTEHARAIDKAIYKELTPQEALDAGNAVIQDELDKFWSKYDKK